MGNNLPRIVIAGLAGDSGKTIVSLSLAAILKQRGLAVSVFKKGPDYIDAAWLSFVTGSPCRNLDTYLALPDDVYRSFCANAAKADFAIIEGNRGIYDGKDVSGTHSTAGLAKLLQAPVVLVVDVTKATRTVAALIKGIIDFEPGLHIAGVVLNRVGGNRHRQIVTESIEKYCGIPALGAIPRQASEGTLIPGRHLGLITPAEYDANAKLSSTLVNIADKYLDIDNIMKIANEAATLKYDENINYNDKQSKSAQVKIGYFADSIFTFYYPENLEALENEGAELVPVSSVVDKMLPEIDALYIGGGFPETQADRLAANKSMMASVRKAAVIGMPIYAECGGLIYLARSLAYNDKIHQMAGIFPIDLTMHEKPVGHGYTALTIDQLNPFFEIGAKIKGHEFHYSGIADNQNETGLGQLKSCMAVHTGVGLGNKRDGLLYNNTFACYTHIHALGMKSWAKNLVQSAILYHNNNGHSGQNGRTILDPNDLAQDDNSRLAISSR